jgi:hypothetical protein
VVVVGIEHMDDAKDAPLTFQVTEDGGRPQATAGIEHIDNIKDAPLSF